MSEVGSDDFHVRVKNSGPLKFRSTCKSYIASSSQIQISSVQYTASRSRQTSRVNTWSLPRARSSAKLCTYIGTAKKPNQTLHFDLSHDDSLDVNALQSATPKVRLSDHETVITTRRGAMGLASTPASKASTQPNFNLTRVVRDDNVVNHSTHGATTCINDPSYNAIDT